MTQVRVVAPSAKANQQYNTRKKRRNSKMASKHFRLVAAFAVVTLLLLSVLAVSAVEVETTEALRSNQVNNNAQGAQNQQSDENTVMYDPTKLWVNENGDPYPIKPYATRMIPLPIEPMKVCVHTCFI